MSIVVLAPAPPACAVSALLVADRLKLGTGIVTTTLVELVEAPEVPVTVTVYVPGIAAPPAVNVSELLVLVTAGLKAAVTPAGHPVAPSDTLLLAPLLPAT
jgi:hypothetical protein